MKRAGLLAVLGAVVLAGAVFVGTASAAPAPGIHVGLTPTTITVTGEGGECGARVEVWDVANDEQVYAKDFGGGSFQAVAEGLTPNTDYEVMVWTECDSEQPSFDEVYHTPSVPAPAAGGVNHVFLCYSAYQTEPGVWPESQAVQLFAEGYWLAYSIPGNVPGGTNVGDYHLVCNLAGTQSVSDTFVGDAGEVLSPDYTGTFQIYSRLG